MVCLLNTRKEAEAQDFRLCQRPTVSQGERDSGPLYSPVIQEEGGDIMAWNLTADFIETCSCNMLCPCWYGVRELMVMDQGWCASTWLLREQQGQADGVNLGGRTLAIALDFPGPTLYDGNGTARIYLDDDATADQRRELEAIFQGTKGGPMAILGGWSRRGCPPHTTQIEIQEHGGTLTATVAGFGQGAIAESDQ